MLDVTALDQKHRTLGTVRAAYIHSANRTAEPGLCSRVTGLVAKLSSQDTRLKSGHHGWFRRHITSVRGLLRLSIDECLALNIGKSSVPGRFCR